MSKMIFVSEGESTSHILQYQVARYCRVSGTSVNHQLIHSTFQLILIQPKYLKMFLFKLLFAALALLRSSSLQKHLLKHQLISRYFSSSCHIVGSSVPVTHWSHFQLNMK